MTDAQVQTLVDSTEEFHNLDRTMTSIHLTMDRYILDGGIPYEQFNFYLEFESATVMRTAINSGTPLPSQVCT